MGYKELEGIHARSDFDLSQHQKHSGKKIQYYDPEQEKSYVPHVIETSIGVDRMVLALLSASYTEEEIGDKGKTEKRVVLKLPLQLAPIKAAILPLVRKDGLPEVGRKVFDILKYRFNVMYEEKDSIGKRYRRQDAIGTPYCITIDHQTLKDNTVTLRHRDTMEQTRVKIHRLPEIIENKVSMQSLLEKLV